MLASHWKKHLNNPVRCRYQTPTRAVNEPTDKQNRQTRLENSNQLEICLFLCGKEAARWVGGGRVGRDQDTKWGTYYCSPLAALVQRRIKLCTKTARNSTLWNSPAAMPAAFPAAYFLVTANCVHFGARSGLRPIQRASLTFLQVENVKIMESYTIPYRRVAIDEL